MIWSPAQNAAITAVGRWIDQCHAEMRAGKDLSQQVFRLFGYAGSGKSTITAECASGIEKVRYAAFTGKAATVMRSKGCAGSDTIHSLIYSTTVDEATGQVSYQLSDQSPAANADLIVIDECSMVAPDLGKDLLSFGRPVLVLGDPAQLPPVVTEDQIRNGTAPGFFTEADPDVMLTEIHRQARDNPIIALATDVREGRDLHYGDFGAAKVIRRPEAVVSLVLAADQVLVGRNDTRADFNARIRKHLGRTNHMPEKGDRLVCLRNDKQKRIFNGEVFTVEEVAAAKSGRAANGEINMIVRSLDIEGSDPISVFTRIECFTGKLKNLPFEARRGMQEFDFGYALTVHKAQGSQWANVMLFNESSTFREDARRWLYTGITRAAETLTVVM